MNEVNNIPEGWVETTLGKVCQNISRPFSFSSIENVVFINTSDVLNGKFLHNEYISKIGLPGQAKKAIEYGDILFSEIRPANGRYAIVDFNSRDFVVSTKFMVIKKNEKIDLSFLYLYLTNSKTVNQFQMIAESRSGTFPQITFDAISHINILLPLLPEQKSIAAILTSFDNKIELLQAQNKTLEETAQIIFKEWFGKYQIGDALPEGWRVGKLGEIASLKSGFAFKSEDFIEESDFKAIKIKDLKGKGNISLDDVSSITEDVTKSERVQYFKLKEGDILLAMSGNTTGKIGVLPSFDKEVYLNQRVGKFYFKNKNHVTFIYNFLMSGGFEDKILAMGYGSAQPNINPSQIENIDLIIPSKEVLSNYLEISIPIFEKALKNNTQIQTLVQTRDVLLPKLMSGEIRVKM